MASKKPSVQYKYLTLISMLYVAVMLAANVLIYKLTDLHGLTLTVGSFITPIWFIIGDIVTEVYGYKECRKLIWSALISSIVFTLICTGLISFPAPHHWVYQPYFEYILGGLPRIFMGSVLGLFLGLFLNSYLISKWKILIQGRYFWLRSIGSSTFGQFIFTATTLMFDMLKEVPGKELMAFIAISYCLKIAISCIIAFPSSLLAGFLKKSEGLDVYDYNTDFNPFVIK